MDKTHIISVDGQLRQLRLKLKVGTIVEVFDVEKYFAGEILENTHELIKVKM